ncbi:MAG: hypothetical protein O7A04_01610 [Acidobacteria bacterium]|nr:hypothetical protein [Acidobacteriota bacterium]
MDQHSAGVERDGGVLAGAQRGAGPVLAFPTVTRDDKSAVLAFTALSAWLILLLIGWTLGGAVHLLFALALLAFPWRRFRT